MSHESAAARGGFVSNRAHRLSTSVALRIEEFGALSYHYGNRRLVFLKSRQLVEVVRSLENHASAADAIDTAVSLGAPATAAQRRRSLTDALSSLYDAGVICER